MSDYLKFKKYKSRVNIGISISLLCFAFIANYPVSNWHIILSILGASLIIYAVYNDFLLFRLTENKKTCTHCKGTGILFDDVMSK